MVMDFAMFFSLDEFESLKSILSRFFLCYGYFFCEMTCQLKTKRMTNYYIWKNEISIKKSALQDLFKTFFRIELSFLEADLCWFVKNQNA